MEAKEFGEYLKRVRKSKKMTIRQLELYSKVSNAYISQLERGDRGIPSPDIIRKLSSPLGLDYNEMMIQAGYVEENKKESEYTLPEEVILKVLREAEEEFKVSLSDDPLVESAVRDLLHNLARMKKGYQKTDQ